MAKKKIDASELSAYSDDEAYKAEYIEEKLEQEQTGEIKLVAVRFYEPLNLKNKISGFWQASEQLKMSYIPALNCIKLAGPLVQKEALKQGAVELLIPVANVPEMIRKA